MRIYRLALVALFACTSKTPSVEPVPKPISVSTHGGYTVEQVRTAVDEALRDEGPFSPIERGLAWMVGEACLNTKRLLVKSPLDETFLHDNCVASMRVAATIQRDHDVITNLNLRNCVRLGAFIRGLISEGNGTDELRTHERPEVGRDAARLHGLVETHALEAARRAYGFCRSADEPKSKVEPKTRFDSSGTVEL